MDQLNALRIFLRVAETGSFSAAARQMTLSKSAVSKQITALEDHLSVKLLYRTTRNVSLTEEGRVYAARVQPLVEELELADRSMSQTDGHARGTLRINAPLNFGYSHIAPGLADFRATHPQLMIDLDLSDRFVDLVEEGFDLSIRITDQLEDSSLIARKLAPVDMVTLAAPDYLARAGTPAHPAQCADHDCLRYKGRRGLHEWLFLGPDGERHGVRVKGPLISNNGEALRQAARDALGLVRLPSFTVVDDLRTGRLVPVLTDWPPPTLGIYALYPANRHLSLKVRAFIDFLAQRFSNDLAWNEAAREAGSG